MTEFAGARRFGEDAASWDVVEKNVELLIIEENLSWVVMPRGIFLFGGRLAESTNLTGL